MRVVGSRHEHRGGRGHDGARRVGSAGTKTCLSVVRSL